MCYFTVFFFFVTVGLGTRGVREALGGKPWRKTSPLCCDAQNHKNKRKKNPPRIKPFAKAL